ncbi:SRPBCC domain-containing protein [Myxococcaceae bacterium JPH2]|nr:SRPBCC domain-containing protein [Myxococcaceae bacterium JPH2]
MHVVTLRAPISHPPEDVWRDLTEGPRLSRWFADSGDLGPEGSFCFDFGDGDCFLGQVTRWVPERFLGWEWRFMGLGPVFHIQFELVPEAAGTLVGVTDRGARTSAEADSLRAGWVDFLSRLERFVTTGRTSRYEWSQTIGTAALTREPPRTVLGTMSDPRWWRSGFEGADVALHSPGPNQVVADFHRADWGSAETRAVVTVEASRGGAYVGITHEGWTALPPALQLPERRRFAALWARLLAGLEGHSWGQAALLFALMGPWLATR